MLQNDRTGRTNTRHRSIVDDRLAVIDDRDMLARHRNVKRVPLADRLVGVFFRQRAFTNRGILIVVKCPKLPGTAGPTPKVRLRLAAAAKENSRIGIGHVPKQRLAVLVGFLRAVRVE